MNKYDKMRKGRLVQTLRKAKEQAEIAKMYLVANDRDPDEIAATHLALEHVEIALEHLGANVTTT